MSCNGNCNGNCTGGSCSAVAHLHAKYPQLTTGPNTMTNPNQCGSYRSIVIPPPTFPDKRAAPNGTFCVTPSGCDPNNPMGGWLTPIRIENIGAWSSGDPIEEHVTLQLAYPGVITALAFKSVVANVSGALLSPANVRIGRFSTTKKRELFPGWGAQSKGSGSVALNLSNQQPSEIMRPIVDFTGQSLLDGHNALPLPMQQLDASGDNALWTCTIDHKKTVAIDLLIDLYISYNGQE